MFFFSIISPESVQIIDLDLFWVSIDYICMSNTSASKQNNTVQISNLHLIVVGREIQPWEKKADMSFASF